MTPTQRYAVYKLASAAYFWAPVKFLYALTLFRLDQVLLLEAIVQGGVFLLEVPSGYFSDRVGRRASLLLSAFAAVAASAMMAGVTSFHWMAVAQVLLAVSYAFRSGSDVAYHAEMLAKLELGHELGSREAWIQSRRLWATAGASLIGGFAGVYDLRVAFVLTAAANAVAFVAAFGFEPSEAHPETTSFTTEVRRCFADLRGHFLAWAVTVAVMAGLLDHLPYNFYQPYLKLLEKVPGPLASFSASAAAGIHVTVTMLLGSWMAAYSHVLSLRFGWGTLMLFALAVEWSLTLAMAAVLHPLVLGMVMLRETGNALYRAPWSAAVVPRVPPERRATFLSVSALLTRLTIAVTLLILSQVGGAAGGHAELAEKLWMGAGATALVWVSMWWTRPSEAIASEAASHESRSLVD